MKTKPLALPGGRRGIALVIVLSFIALLSVLVVAFLGSVSTELGSSSSFAASSDVKQRAQTAVNLVIGQIQAATSQSNIAWASQPGLIRTYDAQGAEAAQYKLYSSDAMVETAFDPNDKTDVPINWASQPAAFTDLNQPALTPDPNGLIKPNATTDKTFIAQYPILDPAALGTGVKGFSAKDPTGLAISAPAASENPLTAGNKLPMPVKWLYMLKNGELRAIGASGTIPDATKVNPPVARIAFWADDETAKVNLNTAAGDEWENTTAPGSFSDQPMASHTFEGSLKSNQPVTHEYQRYPGHPATTYLAAALPGLTREQLYSVTPRVTNLLGTLDVSSKGGLAATNITDVYTTNKPKALPLSKGLPLYSSVDELLYKRSITARTPEDTLFTVPQIERAKFFLTAQSRAPEVTLFNTPRIAMWPQQAETALRTPYDQTIAFASTVAKQPFYFVRKDARSPTADWVDQTRNRDLYTYLQTLTSKDFPGFGGKFTDKYGIDRDQILTEMFDYIRSCINLLDPGTANTFTKPKPWASANIKDFVGGPGHVVPIYIASNDTMGFGRSETLYSPIIVFYAMDTQMEPPLTAAEIADAAAKVPPIPPRRYKAKLPPATATAPDVVTKLKTKGVQAALIFDTFSPAMGVARMVPDLVFELSDVSGFTLDGKDLNFPEDSAVLAKRANHEYAIGGYTSGANLFWDPVRANPAKYPFFSNTVSTDSEYRAPLSFSGGTATLKIYARLLNGSKGDLVQTIALKFPAASIPTPIVSGTIQRDYTANSPIVVPRTAATDYFTYHGKDGTAIAPNAGNLSNGGWQPADGGHVNAMLLWDATRALVPRHGDMRLIAARRDVPDTEFVKARLYNDTINGNYQFTNWNQNRPHHLDYGKSGGMTAGRTISSNFGMPKETITGALVENVKYDIHYSNSDTNRGPQVSDNIGFLGTDKVKPYLKGINGSDLPGDWDTGMGTYSDGPFINKADEGEVGSDAYTSHNSAMMLTTLFSPNRQVPSPAIMGSLSTGVKRDKPWQTLLFCPNPAAGEKHPGFGIGAGGAGPLAKAPFTTPPDHLLLDLFSMPVIEPYAISEPFSTAGKVNMNYQIVPFVDIERSTALQAVLRSTRVNAIPTSNGYNDTDPSKKWGYKTGSNAAQGDYRMNIDIEQTLEGFKARFTSNEMFRSASQICEMYLVPQGQTLANMPTWWNDYKLTGDNLRERPYSQIYSRLTTKSNTFTVHVRVQSLQQRRRTATADYAKWEEGKDKVTGEYRASYIIERYLNPNLQQYVLGEPLTDYKFRTVSTKQFTP